MSCLNTALMRPHYPMRSVEEVAAQLSVATGFSVLDEKNSFWQMHPFGRYRFLRLILGISSAKVRCFNTQWNSFRRLSMLNHCWCHHYQRLWCSWTQCQPDRNTLKSDGGQSQTNTSQVQISPGPSELCRSHLHEWRLKSRPLKICSNQWHASHWLPK